MTCYLLLFVTLIPLCLAGIQQIVYNEMILLAYFLVVCFCLGGIIALYELNVFTASLTEKMEETHKLLNQFAIKYKLVIYKVVHRLSSTSFWSLRLRL